MSYVVLARKWRPMRFEDLIGQDHVARTLKNAIDSGRVAHAFLFTGVRGVGKTTSARILAKALNCMRPKGSVEPGTDPGPTPSPCLECPACLEITQGSDIDVREIDGASYNGVDEVRKLQDSLPYQPTRDRYKIIIVDEVHMLSQSAWNAFLKTLEEPPAHVKFIFATTEVHKVPITILSRVQRFDFKLISRVAIANRLRYVLDREGIQADDEALSLVAREASGSMRDAMSLLDQVIAWGGTNLVGQEVALVLGVASRRALMTIARGLLQADAETCLQVVAELVGQGHDVQHVAKDLLATLRDLAVARVCQDPTALLDLSAEERGEVQALAAPADPDDLVRLHQGFSEGFDDVVRGGHARAALEMLLIRLCKRPPLLPIDDLIQRLQSLEKRLTSSSGTPPARARGNAPHGRDAPAAPRSREHRSGPEARSDDEAGDEPPPRVERTEPPSEPKLPSEPALVAGALVPAKSGASNAATAGVINKPSAAVARAPAPAAAPRTSAARTAPARAADAESLAPVAASATGELAAPVAPHTSAVALSLFRDIVEVVRESRPELAAFLEHAAVLGAEPGRVVLAYPPESMFSDQVKSKDCRELLATAATSVLGSPTEVEFRFDYAKARGMDTLSADRVRAREARMRKAITEAKNHPRVNEALEVLGARLKDLKINEGT